MAQQGRRGHAPVVFDEAASAEDMAAASPGGRREAAAAREALEREGISTERLRPCLAEGPDRTVLEACVKTYVPWPAGRFGIVFALRRAEGRLVLSFLAFGVRHHPSGARAPNLYAIAHRRLHGRWP